MTPGTKAKMLSHLIPLWTILALYCGLILIPDASASPYRCVETAGDPELHGADGEAIYRVTDLPRLDKQLRKLRVRARRTGRVTIKRKVRSVRELRGYVTLCLEGARTRFSSCLGGATETAAKEVLSHASVIVYEEANRECSLSEELSITRAPANGRVEITPDQLIYHHEGPIESGAVVDDFEVQLCTPASDPVQFCRDPQSLAVRICSLSTGEIQRHEVAADTEREIDLSIASSCETPVEYRVLQSPTLGELEPLGEEGLHSFRAGSVEGAERVNYRGCLRASEMCSEAGEVEFVVLSDEPAPPRCEFEYGNDTPNPRLCDVRVVQQSTYSAVNYRPFGMSNRGWSIGSSHLLAGSNLTFESMLTQSLDQIRVALLDYRTRFPQFRDNDFIVLDIEGPLGADHYGNYNASPAIQRQVFEAVAKRVAVAREVFPNSQLGLWNTIKAPARGKTDNESFQQEMEGLRRASAFGVFDDLDYLLPNLYVRFTPEDGPADFESFERMTRTGIEQSRELTKSDGRAIPLVPFMSMHVMNGTQDRAVPWVTARQVEIFQEYPEVAFASYWIGDDFYRGIDIREFLREARPVPTECLCPPS